MAVDPNALWRAATTYARAGKPILPVDPTSKQPLTRNGIHDATVELTQIGKWWRDLGHRAALAIATGERSGFDVLDVDPKHGGVRSLTELTQAHGRLPFTTRAMTPSGGRHLYFRHQPGLLNRVGGRRDVPEGLDCRTSGGYVLVPPSPGYRFEQMVERGQALPRMPEWLAEHFRAREITQERLPGIDPAALPPDRLRGLQRHAQAILAGCAADIRNARPGHQETTLNAAALRLGRLAGSGLVDWDRAFTAALESGLAMRSDPARKPWREREIRQKVARAFEQGAAMPPPADLRWDVPRAERSQWRNQAAERSR